MAGDPVKGMIRQAALVAGVANLIQICDLLEDRQEFICVLRDRDIISNDVADLLFDELCSGVRQ